MVSDKAVLEANVYEDQTGEWGLYIIPHGEELCVTEEELRAALDEIEAQRLAT